MNLWIPKIGEIYTLERSWNGIDANTPFVVASVGQLAVRFHLPGRKAIDVENETLRTLDFKIGPPKYRYKLEHRYQDSGWTLLDGEGFTDGNEAVKRAADLSKNSIAYGMVRVIDHNGVIITFPAGGFPS